jgi:hypothetical protein
MHTPYYVPSSRPVWSSTFGHTSLYNVMIKNNNNLHQNEYRCTRWFKYDRDKLWLVYTQIVPVIFEPPCILAQSYGLKRHNNTHCVLYLRYTAFMCIDIEEINCLLRFHLCPNMFSYLFNAFLPSRPLLIVFIIPPVDAASSGITFQQHKLKLNISIITQPTSDEQRPLHLTFTKPLLRTPFFCLHL